MSLASSAGAFEFVLLLLVAAMGLELLARRLGLPPAVALLAGGIALAWIPGVPALRLDPDLVMALFLPPLLLAGAYFTPLSEFRRHLAGILSLAVGAVAFTTAAVAVTAHLVAPSLPWASCAVLGAVVSPPDAVAAKAVLERLRLPRRTMALLEGESLLNDATGIVLFRFAVAAAASSGGLHLGAASSGGLHLGAASSGGLHLGAASSGGFHPGAASLAFGVLAAGGVAFSLAFGALWIRAVTLLRDPTLMILSSFLASWATYIVGEAIGVSGVLATVAAGMVVGWRQHETMPAAVRMQAAAVWQVATFVLEAMVFILMGLSLHGVVRGMGGLVHAAGTIAAPVLAVVAAVILSRFVWIFGAELGHRVRRRLTRLGGPEPDARAAAVMSWAGMRGVVTLAIALSLPASVPGHALILAAAFGVILVTVLLQGITLGPLIRLLRLGPGDEQRGHLTEREAEARMTAAQLEAVERLALGARGEVLHPRLFEQYRHRVAIRARPAPETDHEAGRISHYRVVLAAIEAGRREVLRLHRGGRIDDEVLRSLEQDLDLEEVVTRRHGG